MARSFLRLQASAARPSGTPTAAYRRVKAVPSQPSWVSLNPHSLRMASLTAPSIWRSKKFIALIANSNQRANRARARSLSILEDPWLTKSSQNDQNSGGDQTSVNVHLE